MLKKYLFIFCLAFILNWFWELAHSDLYLNYQGGPITFYILFRAAAVDAVMISILIFVAQSLWANKALFIVLVGVAVAVAIELWALKTGRWAYGTAMPIVPILGMGLTPTMQLAVTGYLVQKVYEKYSGHHQAKSFP